MPSIGNSFNQTVFYRFHDDNAFLAVRATARGKYTKTQANLGFFIIYPSQENIFPSQNFKLQILKRNYSKLLNFVKFQDF